MKKKLTTPNVSAPAPTPPAQPAAGHPQGQHIVVADRGFVYVGDITVDDQYCRIKRARNIRRWGTTKGLGELRTGPTSATVLDDCGEIIVPVKAVIHYIPCQGF